MRSLVVLLLVLSISLLEAKRGGGSSGRGASGARSSSSGFGSSGSKSGSKGSSSSSHRSFFGSSGHLSRGGTSYPSSRRTYIYSHEQFRLNSFGVWLIFFIICMLLFCYLINLRYKYEKEQKEREKEEKVREQEAMLIWSKDREESATSAAEPSAPSIA